MPSKIRMSAPNFGQWLRLQRGDRSLEQIAMKVRDLVKPTGLKVDQSLIYKIEQGRVPSWPMLAALCRVYGEDIRVAALSLIGALDFPGSADLLCPADGVQHASDATPEPETTNADALARQAAEELLAFTTAYTDAISDVAHRLLGHVPTPTTRDADRPHRKGAPDRLRGARKTG